MKVSSYSLLLGMHQEGRQHFSMYFMLNWTQQATFHPLVNFFFSTVMPCLRGRPCWKIKWPVDPRSPCIPPPSFHHFEMLKQAGLSSLTSPPLALCHLPPTFLSEQFSLLCLDPHLPCTATCFPSLCTALNMTLFFCLLSYYAVRRFTPLRWDGRSRDPEHHVWRPPCCQIYAARPPPESWSSASLPSVPPHHSHQRHAPKHGLLRQ